MSVEDVRRRAGQRVFGCLDAEGAPTPRHLPSTGPACSRRTRHRAAVASMRRCHRKAAVPVRQESPNPASVTGVSVRPNSSWTTCTSPKTCSDAVELLRNRQRGDADLLAQLAPQSGVVADLCGDGGADGSGVGMLAQEIGVPMRRNAAWSSVSMLMMQPALRRRVRDARTVCPTR